MKSSIGVETTSISGSQTVISGAQTIVTRSGDQYVGIETCVQSGVQEV